MSRSVWREVMESSYDKVQVLLLWHWRNQTGAGLSDSTYADLSSYRHFLLLLLYLGFTTNQRSISYGSLVHVLGQSHQRFLLCFVKCLCTCRSWWIGNEGARRYHSGVWSDTVRSLFEHVLEICLFHSLSSFLVKKQNFWSWEYFKE